MHSEISSHLYVFPEQLRDAFSLAFTAVEDLEGVGLDDDLCSGDKRDQWLVISPLHSSSPL